MIKKHKIAFSFVLLTITSNLLFAQIDNPALTSIGSTVNSFVPKGWKILSESTGDLNKDGLADKAVVIENTDVKNFINNDGMGQKTLNLNPRLLLVVFKTQANKYQLAVKNYGFVPSENDKG